MHFRREQFSRQAFFIDKSEISVVFLLILNPFLTENEEGFREAI